jgi:hypothetical protein
MNHLLTWRFQGRRKLFEHMLDGAFEFPEFVPECQAVGATDFSVEIFDALAQNVPNELGVTSAEFDLHMDTSDRG